jgi:hypothetical protein
MPEGHHARISPTRTMYDESGCKHDVYCTVVDSRTHYTDGSFSQWQPQVGRYKTKAGGDVNEIGGQFYLVTHSGDKLLTASIPTR